jgi:magnesium transporter
MSRTRRRGLHSSTKRGMPPGSLVFTGERKLEKTQLTVFDYDADTLKEVPSESLPDCLARRDTPTITWINVDGLHDVEVVERLGQGFGVHPLVLEDILAPEQRAKLEDYEQQLFMVVQMLSWNETTAAVESEQISFVLGARYLLTFQEKGGDVFDSVRERLRSSRGRMRKSGPDYLLYALLDAIVDTYFLILENLDDRIEALEEELTTKGDGDSQSLRAIHRFKRETIFLRRAVWPLREVLAGLTRSESPLVQRETRIFLRDVQDHAVQALETVETFRELLTGMLDIYMSTLNNRLNAVMKVLTIFATIFAPLTFIVGVYGMNFDHMPELRWRWGYPAVLLVMLAIVLGMLREFKRRRWF